MSELIANVTAKLGSEVAAVGGEATFEDGKLGAKGFALSYLDNEGDTVSITTDHDLSEAIALARQSHREKVDLFIHDPEKPPISATVDPRPVIDFTPPASTMRARRRQVSEDDEEEGEDAAEVPLHRLRKAASQSADKEQLIAGVSNDLLLPGAIAGLAVVIIAVFAISRSTSR
jgi:hypothetical protein